MVKLPESPTRTNAGDDNAEFEELLIFSTIINTLPVLYWVKDTRNHIIRINSGAAQLDGRDASEIEGKSCRELFPKELADLYWQQDQEVIRSKRPMQNILLPFRVHKTGKRRWLRVSIAPVADKNGDVYRIVACGNDVTDQVETEKLMQQSEARNQLLLSAIPDMLFVTDKDGNFIDFKAPDSLLLKSPEEFLGKNIRAIMPPEIAEKSLQYIRETHRTGEQNIFEYSLNLNNCDRFFEARLVAQKDMVVSVIRDITDRRYIENELAQSEIKYKELVQSVNSIILKWKRNGEIVFLNEYGKKFFGYTDSEIIGRDVRDNILRNQIITGQNREDLVENLFRHPDDYFQNINENLLKNGSRVWISWMNQPVFNEKGEVIEMLSVGNDITGRKTEEIRNEIMHEISSAIASSMALSDLYQLVLQKLSFFIPGAGLCINLHLDKENKWTCAYCSSPVKNDNKVRRLQNVLSGLVQIKNRTILMDQQQCRKAVVEAEPGFKGKVPCYFIGSPLNSDRKILGILLVYSFDNNLKPVEPLSDIISLIANQLALAISKKATEEKLAQQVDFLHSLMENFHDNIYVKDTGSHFMEISRSYARRLGINNLEEIAGMTDFDIFDKAHAKEAYEDEQTIMNTGVPVIGKEELEIWPSGEKRWVVTSKMPWHNAEGKILGTFGVSVDITRLKQAEESIRQHRTMLETVLNSIPQSVFWKNASSVYLGCNSVFARTVGLNHPDEIKGKTDYDLPWPRAEADAYRADDREVIHSGKAKYHIIEPLQQADGKRLWIDTSKVPLTDGKGEIYGILGVYSDITERKKYEEALIQSEARLREAQQIGKVGSFDLILQDGNTYWSDETYQIYGLEPGTISPNDAFLKYLHPDDRDYMISATRTMMETRTAVSSDAEYRILDSQQKVKYIQERGRLIYDSNGNATRFAGTMQDISAQKTAELAIQESQLQLAETNKMLELVINTIPVRVFWKSRDLLYLGCNSIFAKDVGLNRPDEVIGKSDLDLPSKDTAALYRKDDSEVINTATPKLNYEEQQTTPEGNRVWLRTSKVPLQNVNNEIIGVLGAYDDITPLKEKEEALKTKNEELERFSYTVSHDLRSPLVTIKGFIGLLGEDIEAGHLENIQSNIERIKVAADKMSNLLNNLLELSRIGRFNNPFVKIPMHRIVKETLDSLSGIIGQRQVRIIMPETMPEVLMDSHRMSEVWQNLIENAVKFMGGQSQPAIEIGCNSLEREIEFFIRDNGIGIEEKYHENIFGLFNKLDNKSEGTGFGLALAKRIIEVHGGNIKAESTGRGHGTTFRFTLPITIKR